MSYLYILNLIFKLNVNKEKALFELKNENYYYYYKKGFEIGTMSIKITPCSQDGKALGEDAYTEDPNTLLSKPFCFSVKNFLISKYFNYTNQILDRYI